MCGGISSMSRGWGKTFERGSARVCLLALSSGLRRLGALGRAVGGLIVSGRQWAWTPVVVGSDQVEQVVLGGSGRAGSLEEITVVQAEHIRSVVRPVGHTAARADRRQRVPGSSEQQGRFGGWPLGQGARLR